MIINKLKINYLNSTVVKNMLKTNIVNLYKKIIDHNMRFYTS
ncbi:hypothetical protein Stok01_02405 [Sulfurisphaera tokodaii]